MLGLHAARHTPEETARLSNRLSFRLVTWLWVPLQAALVWWAVDRFATTPLTAVERIGLIASVGTVTGGIGLTYAHELIHRPGRFELGLGDVLLALVTYPHFAIEHVYGHHRHVATPADPVTAREGEGLYPFWARAVPASVVSAWRIERHRARRFGRSPWTLGNRMVRYGLTMALIYLWVAAVWGALGVIAFAGQSVIAFLLLETINYIEHYGLRRAEIAPGQFEPVMARHSWDSNHRFSNWLLINLARHADHHLLASKRYQALDPTEAAPQLPAGYGTMILLALVPPLWRRIMDPRLARLAGVTALLVVCAAACGKASPTAPAAATGSVTSTVTVPVVTPAHLVVNLTGPADGVTVALADSPVTLTATVPAPPPGAAIVDIFEYGRKADLSVFTAEAVRRTGTTTSIELRLSSADADENLYWRVRAQAGELRGEATTTRRIHVALDGLGTPALLAPADGTIQPASPHFQVRKLIHAADPFDRSWSYDIEISGDADFRRLDYSARVGETVTTVVFHTPAVTLLPGTYYWRARAFDGHGGAGSYSAAWRFEIADPFAMTPSPVTPFAGATIVQPATFVVSNDRVFEGVSGTRDEVQVSLSPTFVPVAASGWSWAVNRGAVQVSVSPALGAGTYYWRTRAVLLKTATHPEIASAWSAARPVVVGGQVLGAPTLLEPGPSATSPLRPRLTLGNASRVIGGTALRYQIELSTDAAFAGTPLVTATVAEGSGSTTWTVPFDLPVGLTIWWRARAEEPASGTIGAWTSSRFVAVDSGISLYLLSLAAPAFCGFAVTPIEFYMQSTDTPSATVRRFTARSTLNSGDLLLVATTAADRSVTGTASGFATAGNVSRTYSLALATDPLVPATIRGSGEGAVLSGVLDARIVESTHPGGSRSCSGSFPWSIVPRF